MSVYSFPEYFDIAFQYRDIGKECDFIEAVAEMYSGCDSRKILDVYCGTGRHLIEMLRRGYEVDGFDTVGSMLDYLNKNPEMEKHSTHTWQDTLVGFSTESKYGLLTNMLTSFNYLTTNESVLMHLECAANALEPGGLYIIEMNHPRDLLGSDTSAPNKWSESRDGITVEVDWDYKNAPLDFLTQVYTVNGTLSINDNGEEKTLESEEKIRIFLYQEMKLLIELSGWFSIVDTFGSFGLEHKIDNSSTAWRMILVLKKD